MIIDTPQKAASFICDHGNVGRNPEELLATKPNTVELAAAKRRCLWAVECAFAQIMHHHQIENQLQPVSTK